MVSTQLVCKQEPRRARNGLLARRNFGGVVPDLTMADKTQVELFAAIGRNRGMFRGVIDWPYLNDQIRNRSKEYLEIEGEEAWKTGGGTYGKDGSPTFSPHSQVAKQLVHKIAGEVGGFIWNDSHGIGWAVSLVPTTDKDQGTLDCLAVSWDGGGRIVDPEVRAEYRKVVEEKMARLDDSPTPVRERLRQVTDRLRLYERAEQLFWVIHSAVLMQRKSVVLIPDVLLGEVIWGADKTSWPDNWRTNIADTLWSLSRLHVATLQLSKFGWAPHFNMRSVVVAHVEHLEQSRKQKNVCRPCCSLWNQPDKHGHFLIQIGYGFLGVLENFAINDDEDGRRQFNFKKPDKDAAKMSIKQAQKEGQLVPVHLPTKLFGPCDWVKMRPGPCRIIQALVEEVTRAKKKETRRRDRAELVMGNVVPGTHGQTEVLCPLLDERGRYFAFNGNGLRRGKGYRLVGTKGRGWFFKCGYLSDGGEVSQQVVEEFCLDLTEVVNLLGLTVVGLDPKSGEWYGLERIMELAQVIGGFQKLDRLHLRIYGPEDYLDRLRAVYARGGGWNGIPGGTEPKEPAVVDNLGDTNLEILVQMRKSGISKTELAKGLGYSKQFIGDILNGKKRLPDKFLKQAQKWIAERNAVLGGSVA